VAAPSQTKLIVLNLKAGMPTVEQAKRRLLESLYAPRGASGPVIKIIHGYGSSGKGGAIRSAIREQMTQWQREGKVLKVVPGENWSIFDPASQDLRQRYAFLSKDEDLDRGNAGMTNRRVSRGYVARFQMRVRRTADSSLRSDAKS
jgi:hypothetical protein